GVLVGADADVGDAGRDAVAGDRLTEGLEVLTVALLEGVAVVVAGVAAPAAGGAVDAEVVQGGALAGRHAGGQLARVRAGVVVDQVAVVALLDAGAHEAV